MPLQREQRTRSLGQDAGPTSNALPPALWTASPAGEDLGEGVKASQCCITPPSSSPPEFSHSISHQEDFSIPLVCPLAPLTSLLPPAALGSTLEFTVTLLLGDSSTCLHPNCFPPYSGAAPCQSGSVFSFTAEDTSSLYTVSSSAAFPRGAFQSQPQAHDPFVLSRCLRRRE